MNPKGKHMNAANVAIGLGLKANLSSWKINGLDISSLAGFAMFSSQLHSPSKLPDPTKKKSMSGKKNNITLST
jgi:hypothetical protein